MVLHFSKNGQSFNQLFPYFGCSKYSCFMCSRFLRAHGKISTRGSHGRIFKPWTVPGVSDLAPGQSDILSKALMQLQRDVEAELQMKFKKTLRQEKTSVVGGSSVFSDYDAKATLVKVETERRERKLEQLRISGMFER
jgi:OTT_1508-like deaminase